MLDFYPNFIYNINVPRERNSPRGQKNFKKSLKNPLTNPKPYGIINTNKGKDTLQTRKELPL